MNKKVVWDYQMGMYGIVRTFFKDDNSYQKVRLKIVDPLFFFHTRITPAIQREIDDNETG